MSKYQDNVLDLFPYGSFRDKQKDTLITAAKRLDSEGIKNVIINAPTGVGKSAINVALGRASNDAFYLTPQKKLRRQLHEDDVLSKHYHALRARRDYRCGVTGDNCDDCRINQSTYESCSSRSKAAGGYEGEDGWCTYWNNKIDAIESDIAVLTFAYLVVDGNLDGEGVSSFGDRELLIVDECHNLENQVAQLFMGFDVSPRTLPDEIVDDEFNKLNPDYHTRDKDVLSEIKALIEKGENYLDDWRNKQAESVTDDDAQQTEKPARIERLERFLRKSRWMISDIERGNRWVVNVDTIWYGKDRVKKMELKPVRIDSFLRNNIWNRAEKRVLSTATMPYRDSPSRWCNTLGLDPTDTAVLNVSMPFPKENRPIYTGYEIAEMAGGGDDENWGEIMQTLDKLSEQHDGLNGLVHTASYKRAERVYEDSSEYTNLKDNVIFHQGDDDSEVFIQRWQGSDKDVVVTPSMTDGVDLAGPMCRWQALLKVPFPSIGDSRVDYLLNEKPGIGWPWYYETTANSVIQSVGRAVRSKDDYASYYVLDESFEKLRSKVEFPDWFEEAIVEKKGQSYSAMDW